MHCAREMTFYHPLYMPRGNSVGRICLSGMSLTFESLRKLFLVCRYIFKILRTSSCATVKQKAYLTVLFAGVLRLKSNLVLCYVCDVTSFDSMSSQARVVINMTSYVA